MLETVVADGMRTSPVAAVLTVGAPIGHGDEAQEKLLGRETAVGEYITLNNKPLIVELRGGGLGQRLWRLLGTRSPSRRDYTRASDASSHRSVEDRRDHNTRLYQRRRDGIVSNGTSSDSGHQRRRRPSEHYSRHRNRSSPSHRHGDSEHQHTAPRNAARIEWHRSDDRAEHTRGRQRRHSAERSRRYSRVVEHGTDYNDSRRTESMRVAHGRRRPSRTIENAHHGPDRVIIPDVGNRRGRRAYATPRLHDNVSPASLSVPTPPRRTEPLSYDDMSEDELFQVILAEERAMEPLLRDFDARRAQGEDF